MDLVDNYFNYSVIAENGKFIGRQKDIDSIVNGIKIGKKYSLYGQRRIGKTSLAYKLKEILEPSYKVVICDCGEIFTEKDLWIKIFYGLELEHNFTDEYEIDAFYINEKLKSVNNNILIIFDQFETLVVNKKIPERVYSYLRVICSSSQTINIMTVSKRSIFNINKFYNHSMGSPFFNIFTGFNLLGLDYKDCLNSLKAGLGGKYDSDDILEKLIKFSGQSPYFINVLGEICMRFTNIEQNYNEIIDEFYVHSEPFFSKMLDDYSNSFNILFQHILDQHYLLNSKVKATLLEENIIIENCENSTISFSSGALTKFIITKITTADM